MRRSRLFCQRGEGGGAGVQAQRRENGLDFFLCLILGFLVQNFPGMRGWGSNYLRGGGGGGGGGPNANFYQKRI